MKKKLELTGEERSIDIVAIRPWGDFSREDRIVGDSRPTENGEIFAV